MSDFIRKARVAEQQMRAIFPATPLQRNDHLSARFGADIWLKREDLSPVRSYKIRGALNAIGKALAADPEQACSSAQVLGTMPRAWPMWRGISGCGA